jgi:hypothetical protein
MGKPPTLVLGVGSKVKCVDANFSSLNGETVPILGAVYTVREMVPESCIRLVEIVNVPRAYANGTQECAFKASRFAPVKNNKPPR